MPQTSQSNWEQHKTFMIVELQRTVRELVAVAQLVQPASPLTPDQIFANDELMALNAKHGMSMDELVKFVHAIDAAIKETT